MLYFKKVLYTLFFINAIFIANSALAANKNSGSIIPDIEVYPFYQHSQLTESSFTEGQASLSLKISSTNSIQQLTAILKNWKVPFETISAAPFIIKTDWLLWHYDENTKKTLSEPQNRFFSLNTRDRYRFKFNIEINQEQAVLKLSQTWREQEVDITPDSAMVWLKWQEKPIDTHAVEAFLLRLQTEFEKIALAANQNHPVIIPQTISSKPDELINYLTINKSVATAWSLLVLKLGDKDVSISSADNKRHIITTDWFRPTDNKHDEYHRFKITLTAGATTNESSIFVHHIAVRDKNQTSKKLENSKDKLALEAAFLKNLQLNR
jgi:uncharacterized lipoprotein